MKPSQLTDNEKGALKRLLSNDDFIYFVKKVEILYESLKTDLMLGIGKSNEETMYDRGAGAVLKSLLDAIKSTKEEKPK